MSDKLAIIIVSADRNVIEMGLRYAHNVISHRWMEVQLYFFGPSEVTIATDPDLHPLVAQIITDGVTPHACVWCSNKFNVTEMLRALGCVIEGVGQPVTQAIRDGYLPMTW
jgi:hypothetical protein